MSCEHGHLVVAKWLINIRKELNTPINIINITIGVLHVFVEMDI